MKKLISTSNAPSAIGPYNQAVEVNGTLYISGQLPINPATGKFVDGGITEQSHQCLKNIAAILTEGGYTLDDVVKTTCLLSDIDNFAAMNDVYKQYFTSNFPARAAFAVKALPMGSLVEIEAIAARGK